MLVDFVGWMIQGSRSREQGGGQGKGTKVRKKVRKYEGR